jgi:CBS domain-containing protein
MNTVADILGTKGHAVWSVAPNATVLDALRIMAEHDIGAVLVFDGDKLVGILSERDYARKVALAGRSSKDSQVKDIMTGNVVCIAPDRAIEECMALMTQKRVRHLPVMDRKRVVGMVSIGDVVKATIDDKESTIAQLQSYITG